MSFSMQNIFHSTPAWVFILFVFLIYRGIKACFEQTVQLRKLFILPIIFTILSLHTLINKLNINDVLIYIWLMASTLGAVIGWQIASKQKIKINQKKGLLHLSGSPFTLIAILLIFIVKYYFGYKLSSTPNITSHLSFDILMIGLYGIFTGVFVGRLGNYFYRFKKGPYAYELKTESIE